MATKAKKPEAENPVVAQEEATETLPVVQEEATETAPAEFADNAIAPVENAIADTAPLAERLVEALQKQLPGTAKSILESAVASAIESVGDVSVAELVKTGGNTGLVTVVSQNPNYNGVLYNVSFREGRAICTQKQAKRLVDDFQCSISQ